VSAYWRRRLGRDHDEWTLFRKFGLACYTVVNMARSQYSTPADVLVTLSENEYGRVLRDNRYSKFFDADLSEDARRVELRRLFDIGVKLLTLTLDANDTSKSDLGDIMDKLNDTTQEGFRSEVGLRSQLGALTLTLAYSLEQVASLTDDEVTVAVGIVESVPHFVRWDVLTKLSATGVDGDLTAMLLS